MQWNINKSSLKQIGQRTSLVLSSAAFMVSLGGLEAIAQVAAPTTANTPQIAEPTRGQPMPAGWVAQTPSPSPAPAPAPAPAARAETPLVERGSLLNACRQTNRQVEIFADVALSPVNRVGTVGANTQLTLTGVVNTTQPGRAQVRTGSIVGYVDAGFLTTCTATPTPTPTPTPQASCFQMRALDVLANGLAAYDRPGQGVQTSNGLTDGPGPRSRVFLTNPVTPAENFQGRTYVRVSYTGLANTTRVGWVSQGPVGSTLGAISSNFAPCPQ